MQSSKQTTRHPRQPLSTASVTDFIDLHQWLDAAGRPISGVPASDGAARPLSIQKQASSSSGSQGSEQRRATAPVTPLSEQRPTRHMRRLSSLFSGKTRAADDSHDQSASHGEKNGSEGRTAGGTPKARRLSNLTSLLRSQSAGLTSNGLPTRASLQASKDGPPVPVIPQAYSSATTGATIGSKESDHFSSNGPQQSSPPTMPVRLSSKKQSRRSGLLQAMTLMSKGGQAKEESLGNDEKQGQEPAGEPFPRQSGQSSRTTTQAASQGDGDAFPMSAATMHSDSNQISQRSSFSDAARTQAALEEHQQRSPADLSSSIKTGPRRWSRGLLLSPLSTLGSEVNMANAVDKGTGTFNLHSFRNVRPDFPKRSESATSAGQSYFSVESPADDLHSAPGAATPNETPNEATDSPPRPRTRTGRTASASIPVSAFRRAAGRSRQDLDSLMLQNGETETTASSPVLSSSSLANAVGLSGALQSDTDETAFNAALGAQSPAEELAALEATLPRSRALMLLQRSQSNDKLADESYFSHSDTNAVQKPTSPLRRDFQVKKTSEWLSPGPPLSDDNASSFLSAPTGDNAVGSSPSLVDSSGAETPEVNGAGIGLVNFARQRNDDSVHSSARKEKFNGVKAFHEQHAQALSEALVDSKAEDQVVARIAWPVPPCVKEGYYSRLSAMQQHSLYTQHCRAAESALAEYMRLMAGSVPPDAMMQPSNLFNNNTVSNMNGARRNSAGEVKRSQTFSRSHSHIAQESSSPSMGVPRQRSLLSIRDAGGSSGGYGKEPVPPLPIAPIPPLLTFVTGNANKMREVKSILIPDGDPIRLFLAQADLDLPEIQGAITDVARAKSKAAAQKTKGPCLTEDTALVFAALGDLPGPYIKGFSSALGNANLVRLLHNYSSNHQATAICTFGLVMGPRSEPVMFEGRVEGTIVAPRGSSNFGWDSIFQPKGSSQTFAEMSAVQKAALSHRGKALVEVRKYLRTNPIRLEAPGPNAKPYGAKAQRPQGNDSTSSSPQPGSSDFQLNRSSLSTASVRDGEGSGAETSADVSSPSAKNVHSPSATPRAGASRRHRRISSALVDKARGSMRRSSEARSATDVSSDSTTHDGNAVTWLRKRTASMGH